MPKSELNSTLPYARVGGEARVGGYLGAQFELVAAVTGTGPTPSGFDAVRVEVARQALLRKRAGEVAKHWPLLQAAMGDRFGSDFARWAANRPTAGAWRDGWDFAEDLADRSALPERALAELTERRLIWRYDRTGSPTRRRLPRFTIVGGRLMLQVGGRVRILGR